MISILRRDTFIDPGDPSRTLLSSSPPLSIGRWSTGQS
jgi:hypothetical protein